jgi:hypothetical protein
MLLVPVVQQKVAFRPFATLPNAASDVYSASSKPSKAIPDPPVEADGAAVGFLGIART